VPLSNVSKKGTGVFLPAGSSEMSQKRLPSPFSALALVVIRGYQLLVNPLLAGTGACRFVPSCSEYATGCIHTHGVARGGWLALKRVVRCHPFGGHGLDSVP